MKEAMTLTHRVSQPIDLFYTKQFAAQVHTFRGEEEIANELVETAIAVATEHGLRSQLAAGIMTRGWLLADKGEVLEGISLIREGLDTFQAMATSVVWRPSQLGLLAEAYGKAGQAEKGLAVVAEALALVDKAEKNFFEAELYRLKGELLLIQAEADEQPENCLRDAERSFRHAIDIARQQGAKSLELRAVMNLSRLWQEQGKREEARQMLAEIYGWFTEGFDTVDLKEAKALLAELATA
jgi:predicted ATPase